MEAVCKKCRNTFDKHNILVMRDGLYCEDCCPSESKPAFFNFQFSWEGIIALCDYIDGDRAYETLEMIEKIRPLIDKKILSQIRKLIGGEIDI